MQQLMSVPSRLSYSFRTSITPLIFKVLCTAAGGLLELDDQQLVESHLDRLRFSKISIGFDDAAASIVHRQIKHYRFVTVTVFKLANVQILVREEENLLKKTIVSTIPFNCTRLQRQLKN